jgi:hypothetical protein
MPPLPHPGTHTAGAARPHVQRAPCSTAHPGGRLAIGLRLMSIPAIPAARAHPWKLSAIGSSPFEQARDKRVAVPQRASAAGAPLRRPAASSDSPVVHVEHALTLLRRAAYGLGDLRRNQARPSRS